MIEALVQHMGMVIFFGCLLLVILTCYILLNLLQTNLLQNRDNRETVRIRQAAQRILSGWPNKDGNSDTKHLGLSFLSGLVQIVAFFRVDDSCCNNHIINSSCVIFIHKRPELDESFRYELWLCAWNDDNEKQINRTRGLEGDS